MRNYETLFILKPTLGADDITKQVAFYRENITKHGGEIIKEELWGKQQLAYQIDGFSEGIYVLIQFKANNEYVMAELDKRFKFNEDVVRFVVVMLDEKKFKLAPKKEPIRKDKPASERSEVATEDTEENSEVVEAVDEVVSEEDNDKD